MRTDIGYVRSLEARLEELRTAADQADEEYRDEIERMRLTDAERQAVEVGISSCEQIGQYQHWADRINERAAATLRGLLERTK